MTPAEEEVLKIFRTHPYNQTLKQTLRLIELFRIIEVNVQLTPVPPPLP